VGNPNSWCPVPWYPSPDQTQFQTYARTFQCQYQIHARPRPERFSLESPYFDKHGNKRSMLTDPTRFRILRVLPENAAFSSTPVLSTICEYTPTTSYHFRLHGCTE
jgi:hypothetical protein